MFQKYYNRRPFSQILHIKVTSIYKMDFIFFRKHAG